MDVMTELRGAVDRVLLGDLEPLLQLLDEDVVFQVYGGCEHSADNESRFCQEDAGRQAVAHYFTAFGGMVAFWQMDYSARGNQLVAWGSESFTVEPCGLEGGTQFALVFDLSDGKITRLLVAEDLPSFIRDGGASRLADSLPLELEIHPIPRWDHSGEFPVFALDC
jgi:ketosteroid isomerase-like protein